MSDKQPQPLSDWMETAISPALIMTMVGSLIFFLIEILYGGQFEGRMQWIFFWFIFATVLIARISIQGHGSAGILGIVMAIVMYVSLLKFVEYPAGSPLAGFGWLVNLALMAIVWWSAHRLTWDCTYMDNSVEASGKGVLAAAGLDAEAPADNETADRSVRSPSRPTESSPEESDEKPAKKKRKKAARDGLWERYTEYREGQKCRPHTPGVWVVYFSLAALPLFGLGQALIPADNLASRRYAFWLMTVYVASGLGLLLTTCFLGLRRYMRQRNLRMPITMTGLWLMMGGAMVVVLLALGAFLPRPNAEYSFIQLSKFTGGEDKQASKYAMKRDSHGKGEGSASSDKPGEKDQATDGDGSGTKKDDQASGSREGKDGKGGSKNDTKDAQSQRDGQSKDGSKSSSEKNDQAKDKSDQKDSSDDKQKSSDNKSGGRSSAQVPKHSSSSPIPGLPAWLGQAIKWIVFAVAVIVVICVLLRSGLGFLSNFSESAKNLLAALRNWWNGLFGWRDATHDKDGETEEAEEEAVPRPFADYRNPFWDHDGGGRAPEELVRYSFRALEALAWERGVGRHLGETPLEFSERLADELPALETDVRNLAGLYARLAYARARMPKATLNVLRLFWQHAEEIDQRQAAAAETG